MKLSKLSDYIENLLGVEGDPNGFYAGILRGLNSYPEFNIEIPTQPFTEIQIPDGWSWLWNLKTDGSGLPDWDVISHSSEPDPDWDS